MQDTVVGFTQKQRRFFLDAFNNRCGFHTKANGVWLRCVNTTELEVHHIVPRGWCKLNMRKSFAVNGIRQGIPLCRYHHHQVHPDMKPALKAYREGNKQAFEQMMERRKRLNEQGRPYWNTEWDLLFIRLNLRFVGKFTAKFKQKYPINGRCGLNGRK